MPERHFEPAGVGQSLSLWHVEVPPFGPVPTGTHCGTPELSLQTKLEGHPEVEQSPEWQRLSAPQLLPAGQSVGAVQAVPVAVLPGGVPSVAAQ